MGYRVAGVQMDIKLADPAANLESMRRETKTASSEGAQLVVFPECTISGYCFESLEETLTIAESVVDHTKDRGSSVRQVIAMANEFGVRIVFGLIEQGENGQVFNTAVLVDGTEVLGQYRKTHLPLLGVDRFTTAGADQSEVIRLPEVNLGMNICYDCSFPETSRLLTIAGADLIVLPTNWPPGSGRVSDVIPNVRALENNVYYMAVNRIGNERGFRFIGKSKICDPLGGEIAVANHDQPSTLYADIDVSWARKKHLVSIPGQHEVHRINDRRPDLYGPIAFPNSRES